MNKLIATTTIILLATTLAFAGGKRDRVEKLKSTLNLTEEQTTKVKDIMKESAEHRKQTAEKIRGVLTPEQQQKFDAMKAEAKGKMKERRNR